jgi:hypothetical protein
MMKKIIAFLEALGEARYEYQKRYGYKSWY